MISNQFDSIEAGEYVRIFMFLIVKVQVVTYWILSFLKLKHHRKNMKMVFSSLAPVDLTWLKYFLLSLLFVLLIWFNEAFSGIKWVNDFNSWGYLLAIYALSYFALKQKEIFPFQRSQVADVREIIKETNQHSTKKERIAAEQLESLAMKLKELVEKDKCFLDPDLGLPHLAERISLTPHELSYLLNQGMGISFFEFVNRYRIEEAKLLLQSNEFQHLNILGIAYETGFNSKTTFNTAFKKFTGMSPSEFKKSASGSQLELMAGSSPT
jgi:AraC-like DNA-binding protein